MRTVRIHGHRRAFVIAGEGPALLAIHGIGHDHRTWLPALPALAKNFTVIAPDLLGHGSSDKPRADYSLGGFANGMRDLLTVLGINRATVMGNSLGGGVAMQFAYQFPERTERVILVAAGGLGKSVNPLLKTLSIPGADTAVALATAPGLRQVVTKTMISLKHAGIPYTQDFAGLADVYNNLADSGARRAFLHTLRGVIDRRGQAISMIDRAYLARDMPTMIVWGEKDVVIPVKHAWAAAQLLPGCRFEVLRDAGHMPQEDAPRRFAEVVSKFVAETDPAPYDPSKWRRRLLDGPPPRSTVVRASA
ncbi:MAG: alpha/beta fold hydrolase [Jiangellales bacterium]